MSMGDIALWNKDIDVTQVYFAAALDVYVIIGDEQCEANCLLSMGEVACRRNDQEKAKDTYKRAQALYVKTKDLLGVGNCLTRLGDLAFEPPRDDDTARASWKESLALVSRIPDLHSVGRAPPADAGLAGR